MIRSPSLLCHLSFSKMVDQNDKDQFHSHHTCPSTFTVVYKCIRLSKPRELYRGRFSFKSQRGKALSSCSFYCIYEVFQNLIFRSRKEVAACPPPPRRREQRSRPPSHRELPRSCLRTMMSVDALDGDVDNDDNLNHP